MNAINVKSEIGPLKKVLLQAVYNTNIKGDMFDS